MKTELYKNRMDILNRNVSKLAGGIDEEIVRYSRSLVLGQGFSREDVLDIMEFSVKKRQENMMSNLLRINKGNWLKRIVKKDQMENIQRELQKRIKMRNFVRDCSQNVWEIVVKKYEADAIYLKEL
jgi:hypothetical protein